MLLNDRSEATKLYNAHVVIFDSTVGSGQNCAGTQVHMCAQFFLEPTVYK